MWKWKKTVSCDLETLGAAILRGQHMKVGSHPLFAAFKTCLT